jgi:hypothetical protein
LKNLLNLIVAIAIGLATSGTSHAINIVLEYPAGDLFGVTLDSTAKAAINAAASDLSAAITTTLNAINTDSYTGTNGQTTATFDMKYNVPNPFGAGNVEIDPGTIPFNTVTMKVGTQSLSAPTLGVGGPNGAGYQVSGGGQPGQWIGAVANAESATEAAYNRGGGPTIGTLSGSLNLSGTIANFSIDYGIAYGSISFDKDTSDPSVLSNYWHFSHTTAVAAGKRDLYSVALHEMIHALGIGESQSWTSKISGGDNWTGTEVISLTGSGTDLIISGHVAEGTMSTSIVDGAPQEVVMDPTLNSSGIRKYLTALDLAFLRDIGYSTIIPQIYSPADFNKDGDVDEGDLLTWRNAYGANALGDTDSDGDTDGRDFLKWQREFTGSIPPLSTGTVVPEPGLVTVAISALLCLTCTRRW